MAAIRVFLCLLLFSSLTFAKVSHVEVTQQLEPFRETIETFFWAKIIGQPTHANLALDNDMTCAACHLVINLAFSFMEQGTPEEVIEAVTAMCIELDFVAVDMCQGIVSGFVPHIHHIFNNAPIEVSDVCGVLLQNTGCATVNETFTNWQVIVDQNKPEPVSRVELPAGIPTTKVLHLTDIHPDLDYAVGSLTECGKPMCCRRGEHWEEPWNATVQAGFYGDYACDIPQNAMVEAFQNAASRYDYKFVMLGGDYVHHAVWLTTKEDIIRHYTAVADGVLAAFPNTPVYPVVGNHESHPTNVFPPSSAWANQEFNISWVYNTLADLYASKLTPEALVTFRRGGYYSVSPEPKLRVIALNNMFCYTLNFWILYDPADPEGQLQWFSQEMQRAEDAQEQVFILGHIPPGVDDCWSIWNNHYSAVIDRYQNIIIGQFYGHTHNDDFRIFFDEDRPSSAAFVSPSITAYTDINPGYKVFHFDGERVEKTWEMVDYEVFTYNLTEANLGEPQWYQLYSAKDSYGLTSLRPADLYDFVLRMAEDQTLFDLFYLHYNKNSDQPDVCDDAECIRDLLCEQLTSNDNDKSHCAVLDEPLNRRFQK